MVKALRPNIFVGASLLPKKEKIMEKKQTNKIRLITGTAMLTAVAVGFHQA